MSARQGCRVTVIDVDPAAEELARTYFGLDDRARWLTTEPFSFIEACNSHFEAVVVDACNADGLVAPFGDPEVLVHVLKRACPDGSLVLNLAPDEGAPPRGRALARKIAARGLNVTFYRAEGSIVSRTTFDENQPATRRGPERTLPVQTPTGRQSSLNLRPDQWPFTSSTSHAWKQSDAPTVRARGVTRRL